MLEEFEAKTGGRFDALDITDDVAAAVRRSGVGQGTALVFSPHTTCSILLAPAGRETVARVARRMEEVAPRDTYYAHDDLTIRTENLTQGEPANAPAHVFHVVSGRASECVPVGAGELLLGDDQRILFVELDCSRKRRYVVQIVGE